MRPTVHGTLQHIYMYLTEKTNIMIVFLCGAATKAISAMGIVGQSFLGNLLNLTSTTMEDLFNNIIQILHTHTNTHTHKHCNICSDFNDIQIMRVIYICDQELCEGTGRLVEAAAIQRRNRCETESQARLMDDGGRHQVTFLSSSRKCFLKRIHLTDWEHILAFFNLVIASKSYSTLSSLSKGVASSELGLRSEGAWRSRWTELHSTIINT